MKNLLFQTLIALFLLSSCHTKNPMQDNPDAATSIDTGSTPHYASQIIEGPDSLNLLSTELPEGKVPHLAADLQWPVKTSLVRLDHTQAGAAAQLGYTDSLSNSDWLYIEDQTGSTIINNRPGKIYGAGLRCFVRLKSIPGSPPLNLGVLANLVESGKALATYQVASLGTWKSNGVMTGFPSTGIFNVCAFRKLGDAGRKMEKYLKGSKDSVTVVELPKH